MNNQQTSRRTSKLLAMLLAISSFTSATSYSLEADTEQELVYTADGPVRMSIEGEIRLVEMSDNVIITRGTMEIRGNSATIEFIVSSGEISNVTVVGAPVHYRQQLDSSDEPVNGSSNSISFYTDPGDDSSIIELVGDAVIESPSANFKCSEIIYIAEQDLIRDTVGPCSGVFNTSN